MLKQNGGVNELINGNIKAKVLRMLREVKAVIGCPSFEFTVVVISQVT